MSGELLTPRPNPCWGWRERHLRLLFVDRDGVPRAVQHISIEAAASSLRYSGRIGYWVRWRDCMGRVYLRSLDWILNRDLDTRLATRDQLYVCRNYARMLLEQDVSRWWGKNNNDHETAPHSAQS